MNRKKAITAGLLLILVVLPSGGCNELEKDVAPVELIATATQDVTTIDILNPPSNVGTVTVQARVKRADISDTRFLDVRLSTYRITYRRTDGGTLIPEPLVRTISGLVPVGGGGTALNDIIILSADQIRQAPFVALLPQNGGRDPETGRTSIRMQVVIDIFGETLEGDDVSARVIEEFTFCAGCS